MTFLKHQIFVHGTTYDPNFPLRLRAATTGWGCFYEDTCEAQREPPSADLPPETPGVTLGNLG